MASALQEQASSMRRTMQSWSPRARLLAVLSAVLLTTAYAIYYGHMLGNEFEMYDGEFYVMIAKGETAQLLQPFASRQLGPLVVRGLMALLHTNWHVGFVIEAVFSMAVLLGWSFYSMSRTQAPRWLMAAMVALPFWRTVYHGLILPDLFYGALLCVFLALIEAEQLLWAAAFLLPLMVARESTSLTLVCFLIATWKRLGWTGRGVAVGASALGSLLVGHLTAGLQNVERLPQSIYMLAKIPWNTVRLTGVNPWANLYTQLCVVPTWQHSLHLGRLQAVGICGYNVGTPMIALSLALYLFGLLLPLVFFMLRARRWQLGDSSVLRFAVIYGGVCFLLAPLLGTAYDRLFSYAWPLVVVALPRLWTSPAEHPETSTLAVPLWAGISFAVLNVAFSVYSMYLIYPANVRLAIDVVLTVLVGVGCARFFPRPRKAEATV